MRSGWRRRWQCAVGRVGVQLLVLRAAVAPEGNVEQDRPGPHDLVGSRDLALAVLLHARLSLSANVQSRAPQVMPRVALYQTVLTRNRAAPPQAMPRTRASAQTQVTPVTLASRNVIKDTCGCMAFALVG